MSYSTISLRAGDPLRLHDVTTFSDTELKHAAQQAVGAAMLGALAPLVERAARREDDELWERRCAELGITKRGDMTISGYWDGEPAADVAIDVSAQLLRMMR